MCVYTGMLLCEANAGKTRGDFALQTPAFHFSLPSSQDDPLAITHVTVLPIDEKRLLPDHTVVLKNGYIEALGSSNTLTTDGIQQVDGTDKYLLPGLADMHVHYWDRGDNPGEFALFLANGVTFVRNMWGHPSHLALARHIQQGDIPGPRLVTTSPIIDGPNTNGETVHPGSTLLIDPEAAHDLVAAYAARGYQQIKVYSQLTLPVLQALGRACAQFGLRMTGHCLYRVTFEEAIAAGMTCFEHLTAIENGHLLQGVAPINFWPNPLEAYRQRLALIDYEAIRRLAGTMARQQIWNCPTMVVYQPRAVAPTELMQNSWLAYETPEQREQWLRAIQRTEQAEAWLEIGRGLHEMHLRVVAILHEEGAPLLVGTDTPNPFVYQGFSLHQELDNLVQAGLSPYETLCCGTREAARFLGEEARQGTISPGKRADLLLVRAHPFADIRAVRDLEAVFVNGFFFRREHLDELLEQRIAAIISLEQISSPMPVLEPAEENDGQVIRQGILLDYLQGHETGRLVYRHCQRSEQTLLIEEYYAGKKRGREKTRLVLRADGVILEGQHRRETSVGIAVSTINRLGQEGYQIHVKEVDGYETLTVLNQPSLIPDELLAVTALPTALTARQGEEGPLLALSLQADGPQVTLLSIFPSSQEDGSPSVFQEWHVSVERSGQPSFQWYQADPDGKLICMRREWRGRPWREMRALVE